MAERTTGLRSILGIPKIYEGFQHLAGATRYRKYLVETLIRPVAGMRVLDIGCATGEILNDLPGVAYQGFDPNPDYIDKARRLHPEAGFRCARVSTAELEGHELFDVALAIGVLHHLDDDEGSELFRLASHALKPGGRLVTSDGCFVDGQSPIARWLIRMDRGKNVRREQGYRELAGLHFEQVSSEVRHDLARIPYTHCLLECRK